jgi:hypothetical protein
MMKKDIVKILLAFICGLLLILLLPLADARTRVGAVEKVENSASASYRENNRRLHKGAAILFEDLLRTGAQSRLSVILADGSDLTLGENAQLLVDDFVYVPQNRAGKLALKALQGAFLFIGGKVEYVPDAEVSITTPVATLGIRGTTVWGGLIDDGYGILTLDGVVTVTNNAGSVTLNSGEGSMLTSIDEPPGAPVQWSQDKTFRAIGMIRFPQ